MKGHAKERAAGTATQTGMIHSSGQARARGTQEADSRVWLSGEEERPHPALPCDAGEGIRKVLKLGLSACVKSHPTLALPCDAGEEIRKALNQGLIACVLQGSPAKVSHWAMSPLAKPVLNHCTRCAEVP